MTHTRLYRDGALELEDFPVQDISEYVGDPACTVWLDVHDPDSADFAMITEEFGLHQLAIEDARHEQQRPKLDTLPHPSVHERLRGHHRPGHRRVRGQRGRRLHHLERADHHPQGRALPDATMSWSAGTTPPTWRSTACPSWCTACSTTWSTVTSPPCRSWTSASRTWRSLLFEDGPEEIRTVQRRSFELRKSLVRLRRVVLPMREVVNSLLRRDLHVVAEPMMPYYQDVYDHVLRATEWTESLRDLVTTVMETNLTVQGNRMNMIMKKVTSWAAIIAVPTAVTGFYGQNVPYPGFGSHLGFWTSAGIMIALSALLYRAFKRRDWI